jgi:hypothetical protein
MPIPQADSLFVAHVSCLFLRMVQDVCAIAQSAAASATLYVPTFWPTILEGLGTSTEFRILAEKIFKGQFRCWQSSMIPVSLALVSIVAIPAIALSVK